MAKWILACVLLAVACDSGGGDETDAADDVNEMPCASDVECNDGSYCNGDETCMVGDPNADVRGCLAGTPPCAAGSTCDEATDSCTSECPDADADGALDSACGGTDCDDTDPLRYPGNTEVCDPDDRDEDCDDRTFGVRDADGDGSPDVLCCNGTNCGDDCDDTRAAVNPRQVETCDGLDNDCDGTVDEEVALTFYEDADGDDFGSDDPDAMTVLGCMAPPGFADNNTDCDDSPGAGAINPGVPEVCEGSVDENCDGTVDEDCDCTVPDSRMCPDAVGVCAGGMQTCVAGTWSDCSIMGTVEICDGIDNDCNGTIDNGVDVACYADPDQDGFAAVGATLTRRCACLANETMTPPTGANIDCREAPATSANVTFPGASEICDGIDNDCSSGGGTESAEDRDGDMYTALGFAGCSGGPYPKQDCNDNNVDVNPDASDYETTGYCIGASLCDCGGVMRCISSMMGCFGICSPSSGTAPSFDYNCNGTEEVQPRRTGGCGPGGCVSPCGNGGCGPSATYPSSSCGDNVTFSCCGGCPCMTTSQSRPLGCR